MDQIKIGRFIAGQRHELGLTQAELGSRLGVTDKSVSKWERGVCLPDASLFERLCGELGCSISELFAGEKLEEERILEASETSMITLLNDEISSKRRFKRITLTLTALIIAVVIPLAGALAVLNSQGYFDRNYIRPYGGASEGGSGISNLLSTVGNSELYLYEYKVTDDCRGAKLHCEVYKGSRLLEDIELPPLIVDSESAKSGRIAIEVAKDMKKFSVGVEQGGAIVSMSDVSFGFGAEINAYGWSNLGEAETVDASGKTSFLVINGSSNGEFSGYGPEAAEEAIEEGRVRSSQYTILFCIK